MMKIKTVKMIDVGDWDELVVETYGRPYSFQQQDGCKDRGLEEITVPSEGAIDFENDSVPEIVNHNVMGVSFSAWLKRDPFAPLSEKGEFNDSSWSIQLWWQRNFYPSVEMIVNDLYKRGLLEAGQYIINIDW